METDLEVLRNRIERLEGLLGPSSAPRSPCIHVRLREAQEKLRAHVPDEMAAAKRAIDLLANNSSPLSSRGHVQKARAARAEVVVNRAAAGLMDLKTLLDGEELNASLLAVDPQLSKQLGELEENLSGDITRCVDEEEQALEQLLIEFNASTAQLNERILALANEIRLKEGAKG